MNCVKEHGGSVKIKSRVGAKSVTDPRFIQQKLWLGRNALETSAAPARMLSVAWRRFGSLIIFNPLR